MKRRVATAGVVLALACMSGSAASAHHGDDTTDPSRCDTWTRTSNYSHSQRNPNDQDLDDAVDTPLDLYVMDGGDIQGKGPRYGVAGRDFYLETMGGGGFGAGGTSDPEHRSGEGGVVQGEVDPSNSGVPSGGSVPNASFSVNSFSMDDPLDNSHFVDTAQGACVEVGGNKVDPGEIYIDTHHIDVVRNGCQVSNPAAAVLPTTKTCIAWRTINIVAAVNGSWTVRTYKTTSCSDTSSNVYQTITASGPQVIQNRSLGATAKRCVRMTLAAAASGVLAVSG